jgi:hypothetical protein
MFVGGESNGMLWSRERSHGWRLLQFLGFGAAKKSSATAAAMEVRKPAPQLVEQAQAQASSL